MHISSASFALLLGTSFATPLLNLGKRASSAGPKGYIAFGDSYAAGIGAGTFFKDSFDDDGNVDNTCGRTNGAYPLGLVNKNLLELSSGEWKDFFACTGDTLDDLEHQITEAKKKGGGDYDVATVSIGGNDFRFGQVAKNCAYRFGTVSQEQAERDCDHYIGGVEEMFLNEIKDAVIFPKYTKHLIDIYENVLKKKGLLIVTGYAQFFAGDNLNTGNNCENLFTTWKGINSRVPLKAEFRRRMNALVKRMNDAILDEVIQPLQSKYSISGQQDNIEFFDIDPLFNGHRFCENVPDPLGSNNNAVWITELNTTPLTQETFKPLQEKEDREGLGFAKLFGFAGILPSDLQQMSTMHPKKDAYEEIADRLMWRVMIWSVGR